MAEVILEKGGYALIKRGINFQEYAVVRNLNKADDTWDYTVGNYAYITSNEAEQLSKALDLFRERTEDSYIPRCRLEELATLFKDGLIEDDEESAMEYFDVDCEMSEEEKEFFGIERDGD